MRSISLLQPAEIVFGENVFQQLPDYCRLKGYKRILFIVAAPLLKAIAPVIEALHKSGVQTNLMEYTIGEPTVEYVSNELHIVKSFSPDCVVGVGGGSVLDSAKLYAALHNSKQQLEEVFGNRILSGRNTGLICAPTTAGTGSEVSPNAILLDETTMEKKGVISPYLVPDICYIDPALTVALPAKITAETAMDALSHCIEAYTNKNSHPIVDNYALEGIRLIAANLEAACKDGKNIAARGALALGSMYGGLCLGPVNTAAVHALSYGLGGKYHVSHGLANAILLPEVMKFNIDANIEKHRQIALAVGISNHATARETAMKGIDRIREISIACGIPQKLSEINIRKEDVEELADLAMKVQRLLVNNPREVKREDAISMYNNLF